jgi:hypothetical protein
MILVALDLSYTVCYITRFTEENFACLIAFIFIYKVHDQNMASLVSTLLYSGKKQHAIFWIYFSL